MNCRSLRCHNNPIQVSLLVHRFATTKDYVLKALFKAKPHQIELTKGIGYMNISFIIKIPLLFAFSAIPCYAATVNFMDLPAEIRGQANMAGHSTIIGDYYIEEYSQPIEASFSSDFATGSLSAFRLLHSNDYQQNYNQRWLIRYDLDAHSKSSSAYSVFYNEQTLSGPVWLSAPDKITQNGDNLFTLYDHISLNLTHEAAVDGSGVIKGGYNSTGYPVVLPASNMTITGGSYNFCPECRVDMDFNLIGFSYDINGNFTINSTDTRALLFSFTSTYEGFGSSKFTKTDLFVQPVPLPAAAWFFASGLLAFAYRIKLAKKRLLKKSAI